jgi:hypothetical protein
MVSTLAQWCHYCLPNGDILSLGKQMALSQQGQLSQAGKHTKKVFWLGAVVRCHLSPSLGSQSCCWHLQLLEVTLSDGPGLEASTAFRLCLAWTQSCFKLALWR